VLRCEFEVIVGAQQRQIVPDAQLGEERVDRADLNTCSAACVPKVGRRDMVLAIRLHQGKRSETLNDLYAGLGSGETLEQFLENQPGRHDEIARVRQLQA